MSSLILFGIVLWYIVGCVGFAFWWKWEFGDISKREIPLMLLSGMMGPIAWIAGFDVHANSIKKEGNNGRHC